MTVKATGDGRAYVASQFSAQDDETEAFVPRQGLFALSIAGTFTGTIALQRALAEGVWNTVETYTEPTEEDVTQSVAGTQWRLVATDLSDGTVDVNLIQAGRQQDTGWR